MAKKKDINPLNRCLACHRYNEEQCDILGEITAKALDICKQAKYFECRNIRPHAIGSSGSTTDWAIYLETKL